MVRNSHQRRTAALPRILAFGVAAGACAVLAGCSIPMSGLDLAGGGHFSDDALLRNASAPALKATEAKVITGNDAAFRSKLEMVKAARSSIDAAYYLYGDDYSASVMSEALIEAAKRGVKVRLRVDYFANYGRLDHFAMLERAGNGNIAVRFYGRPTREMIIDAAYMTLGCGAKSGIQPGADCSAKKLATIESRFAGETIAGRPARDLNISNVNTGNSGLFLSGIYGRKPQFTSLALSRGHDIDDLADLSQDQAPSAEQKEGVKRLGKLYWKSRTEKGFNQLVAKLQLAAVASVHGETVAPVYNTFTSYLPAERPGSRQAAKDWEYASEFLHHKLLLVDQQGVQLGGRNMEDSYHMRPNPMLGKYVFMDTDLRANLGAKSPGLTASFDRLWNYRILVADLNEVRSHAPNDYTANADAFAAAAQSCGGVKQAAALEACQERELARRFLSREQREQQARTTMQRNASAYRTRYAYRNAADPQPQMKVDSSALMAYLENLPFRKMSGDGLPPRTYGARAGKEAKDGKHIHAVWISAMEDVCRSATAANPQRILLHNAYFFPPSDLIDLFGRMADGRRACPNVTVTILTNSLETTDLNVVNLLARHATKAFAEHYQAKRDPTKGARFEYYEYRPAGTGARQSLHTKVAVIGPDVVVGSANLDVRSFMLDSNNAMALRDAPELRSAYVGYLDELLKNRKRTVEQTKYFVETPRATMLQEDRASFRELVAKYRAERWLDPAQVNLAEAQFVEILDRVYALTQKALAGDRDAQEELDRRFKTI